MSMNINIDYAADDSCQLKLWAKGHHKADEFLTACEIEIKNWDGRVIDLSKFLIKHTHFRTVPADKETKSFGVCDFVKIECKPAKGAYPVTELINWLPLFTND